MVKDYIVDHYHLGESAHTNKTTETGHFGPYIALTKARVIALGVLLYVDVGTSDHCWQEQD